MFRLVLAIRDRSRVACLNFRGKWMGTLLRHA
jgi:hypothetical protein